MTESTALPERAIDSAPAAPLPLARVRPLYWSIRRELWENRSIYVAPLAVAGAVLLGFLLTLFRLPAKMRTASSLEAMKQHELIARPFNAAAALIMITFLLVAAFYCLEALHGDRRDRSILFWKSLPVSDLTAVLSKASIPFLVLPLLAFAITVVTQLIMLLLSSVVVGASGQSVAILWEQASLFRTSVLLLYHLLAVHALWEAPLYAWLLLVSAWARRAAFLWAVLPPLAICVLEKMVFNTWHFAALLGRRFSGDGTEALVVPGAMPMHPMTHLTPGTFLANPGLWLGLAVAAAFLAAAVRLRRYRGPV
jgi:ABC-2 type transport system permease protein